MPELDYKPSKRYHEARTAPIRSASTRTPGNRPHSARRQTHATKLGSRARRRSACAHLSLCRGTNERDLKESVARRLSPRRSAARASAPPPHKNTAIKFNHQFHGLRRGGRLPAQHTAARRPARPARGVCQLTLLARARDCSPNKLLGPPPQAPDAHAHAPRRLRPPRSRCCSRSSTRPTCADAPFYPPYIIKKQKYNAIPRPAAGDRAHEQQYSDRGYI